MDLAVVNQRGSNNTLLRDYRKGNWTLQETMVLIEAKKLDNERRMKRSGDGSNNERGGGKPAELRWKWVEDYCWKNGCLRSQNQCNDKWDNLMRDFKKVREYERRVVVEHQHEVNRIKSYWIIDKTERKENHLPSSMLLTVYEALVEVVEKKGQRTPPPAAGCGGGSSSSNVVLEMSTSNLMGHNHHSVPSPLVQQNPITQPPSPVIFPLPPPAQAPAEPHNPPVFQALPTVDSDNSPAKRRKASGEGTGGGGGGGGATSRLQEIGSAISRSASIIAEAIESCEEREEGRHRELLRLQERWVQIEESKAKGEMNRQGIDGLVDAINKLATSIFALATHGNNQGPPT